MKPSRFLTASAALTLLLALAACGGGGAAQPAPVSTLAYVVNECRTDAAGATLRQRLQIRRGDQAPITVVEHSAAGITDGLWCALVGGARIAFEFVQGGVFNRLGVTPDGSQVVFEVTDDGALTRFPPNTLPPAQEGIFIVRADGTGLRRLGPASRAGLADFDIRPFFVFSPNGRTIAYTDNGPCRDYQDAVQIFTLHLTTAERKQVTCLPPAGISGTYGPLFNDDEHITFFTYADVDGLNPAGENIGVTVNTTNGEVTIAPPPAAIPGSQVLPAFRITGSEVNAANLVRPGPPENPTSADISIQEVFVVDRDDNVLQLTNFRRVDTASPTLIADGQRVVFVASANPLGTNPTKNCQIFSIDRTGSDLRQLTDFHEVPEGRHARSGCFFGTPPFGCAVNYTSRDMRSDALIFLSSCDPFGTNRHGVELFAMHTDGTGLRQLTHTQGYRKTNGAVTTEMLFPFAYPGLTIVYNNTPNRTPDE